MSINVDVTHVIMGTYIFKNVVSIILVLSSWCIYVCDCVRTYIFLFISFHYFIRLYTGHYTHRLYFYHMFLHRITTVFSMFYVQYILLLKSSCIKTHNNNNIDDAFFCLSNEIFIDIFLYLVLNKNFFQLKLLEYLTINSEIFVQFILVLQK